MCSAYEPSTVTVNIGRTNTVTVIHPLCLMKHHVGTLFTQQVIRLPTCRVDATENYMQHPSSFCISTGNVRGKEHTVHDIKPKIRYATAGTTTGSVHIATIDTHYCVFEALGEASMSIGK